jgi:hypothetical protein
MASNIDLNIREKISKFSISASVLSIIIALFLNIRASSIIDFQLKLGTREKSECGNEYLESETPNYEVYNVIVKDKSASSQMNTAFLFVQFAWAILIIYLFIAIMIDIVKIFKDIRATPITDKSSIPPLFLGILTTILFIIYLITYSIYINKIRLGLSNADIGGSNNKNFTQLLALYLPTLYAILPVFYIAYKDPENFSGSYFIIAFLYVIIITIAIQFNLTSLNVISTLNSSYNTNVNELNSKIQALLTNASSNTKTKLKDIIKQNVKAKEVTDGDNFIIDDKIGQYWKYILHQNGKELDLFMNESSVDYESNQSTRATITNIRVLMRKLRNDQDVPYAVNKFVNGTLNAATVVFTLILFAIFHFMYKHMNKPVAASMIIGCILVFLIILGPFYGVASLVVTKSH